MDENKSPQDFLNEIFEKSQAAVPPVPPARFGPSLFEPPGPGDDPPPAPPNDEPAEKHGSEAGTKLFPWLCVMLGAALLVLAVCLFQLTRMNHRLDGLQQAVEAVQSVDDLREENERLQEQLDQTEKNAEHLRQSLDDSRTALAAQTAQKKRLDYLWYMGQFMDHGDYPMAALVATLSAQEYFPDSFTAESLDVYLNLERISQYRAYCRELADKGYLTLTFGAPHQSTPTVPTFPGQWNPEQNPDMAALGILWCALDEYYVADAPGAAAQHLISYQWYSLGESRACYPQRIRDTASDYTIEQYERLIHDLTESGWLAETDGILYYKEGQFVPDVLYNLPFDPPGGYLYGETYD